MYGFGHFKHPRWQGAKSALEFSGKLSLDDDGNLLDHQVDLSTRDRAAFRACSGAHGFVHDAPDGARAAAALGAAAETALDPAGRERPPRLDGGADMLIAQHIARTDDHGAMALDCEFHPQGGGSANGDRRYRPYRDVVRKKLWGQY